MVTKEEIKELGRQRNRILRELDERITLIENIVRDIDTYEGAKDLILGKCLKTRINPNHFSVSDYIDYLCHGGELPIQLYRDGELNILKIHEEWLYLPEDELEAAIIKVFEESKKYRVEFLNQQIGLIKQTIDEYNIKIKDCEKEIKELKGE